MSAKLLDGVALAKRIKEDLKQEVEKLKTACGRTPHLASIQVGETLASAVYIKSQEKSASKLGIGFKLHTLPAETSQDELISFLNSLREDEQTTGIILQLPLPQHISSRIVRNFIDTRKDVEGVHPENLGQTVLGKGKVAPSTALAVMELIKSTGVNLYGKEAVVVGHSEIVGKPVGLMLLDEFATTTICHIATGERGILPEHVSRGEILIVAVGKAGLIKGEWVKEGAIVVDVGINKVGDKLVGDVEFEEASKRAGFITPVPGGVGPVTVTMLMKNTVETFKLQRGL